MRPLSGRIPVPALAVLAFISRLFFVLLDGIPGLVLDGAEAAPGRAVARVRAGQVFRQRRPPRLDLNRLPRALAQEDAALQVRAPEQHAAQMLDRIGAGMAVAVVGAAAEQG